MKHAIQFVIAMSFIAMFLVSPVAAATSQGLEWAVAVDDEFTFQYTVVEEGVTTLNEGVNFTIGTAPGFFADPVTTWGFPAISIDMVYTNGTALSAYYIFMLIGVLLAGGGFVVPIGNFTLLSELLMDSTYWGENSTLVNDASKWGVHATAGDSETTSVMDVHYLKTDGFISRYSIVMSNTTSGVDSSITLVRDGAGFDIVGFLTDNILYVGIGVGVLLILAVVCMRRK